MAQVVNVKIKADQQKALFERIEDEYDIAVAKDAYNEYVKDGCKSRPISKLWEELDL